MTKKTVSVWAKKNFIGWFIENNRFSNDNPINILKELAQTEELLCRLKLVLNGSSTRPLIVVSTEGIGMPPLLYKTNDQNLTDLESILEKLYSEMESSIYLTLYYPERSFSEPYLLIAEDTSVTNSNQTNQLLIDFELSLWFAGFQRDQKRAEILRQIDQSLAEGKKREFRRLVKKLKNL
jgi:uncharacterized protein YpiB (UPF0302 family)